MRILMMPNNFPWPGDPDGIFNLRQAQALRELGHEIRVLRWVPRQPPMRTKWAKFRSLPRDYEFDGFRVRTMRSIMGPSSRGLGMLPFQVRSRVAREVAAFRPDVGHVHGLLPAGMLGVSSDIPFVLTAHGSETYRLPYARPGLRALASRVVSRAAACVAVSGFCANHLREFGAQSPSVIFNGADARTFHPRDRAAARAQWQLDLERPVVLYAGHMAISKGMRELRTAMLALRDLNPQYIFAGDEVEGPAMRELVQQHGISAHFTGWVDHEQLATLLAACDMLVLPSHAEGLPTVLCEAMNAARAVVATPVGGIPEIVTDGRTGFLVPVGDGEALGSRIRTILENPSLRERFEREALAFGRERLTWNANARAYDTIYQAIVERARHGHAETRTLTGFPTGT